MGIIEVSSPAVNLDFPFFPAKSHIQSRSPNGLSVTTITRVIPETTELTRMEKTTTPLEGLTLPPGRCYTDA
jgi:hypothetical protein